MSNPQGYGAYLTNKTGGASVKGTVVRASTAADLSFVTSGATEEQPIGVVYDSGVADGSPCFVVLGGLCQVLLEDSTASTHGNWVYTTIAGRGNATLANPPSGGAAELQTHMQELGHCVESKTAGTDVLAWIVLHFN